ncbi:hypothetical protein [Geomesophilobacter sediminis]|uniref:Uncharacterized protein n=1 Tax=Geomesophilobacter sediminis TaxID=2798584 RepID=A0A8J7JBA5_9BACT|nr:hypothetical protein [Geomesophilobacter sediminis]MBJ6724386.1 hypothetical protein [Geomesophilobacter sediminis]
MQKQMPKRVARTYRNLTPSKFYVLNLRVRTALTDNPRIPYSTWANPTLISSYFAASDKHAALHHQSAERTVSVITERDLLQAQIVDYLDEIASGLEAASVRDPEILLVSGFDLTKERRSHPRTNGPSPEVSVVNEHEGGPTGDPGA